MHIREYQAACEKIRTAPLTLTKYEFSVLEAFNPADERRAHEAVRVAQLALVATHTKAAPSAALDDDPAVLVDAFETVIRRALAPVVARLRALEAATANLDTPRAQVAALDAQRSR